MNKYFAIDGSGKITKEQIEKQKTEQKLLGLNYVKNEISPYSLNTYHNWDARKMDLPDSSIDMIITSPPYNVGIRYGGHNDAMSRQEYLNFTKEYMAEFYRVLADDGRLAINIANTGRSPYLYNSGMILEIAEATGFSLRGEIVWAKTGSTGTSSAWGSWMSSSNPSLRDKHEYILVFHKKLAKKVHMTTKPDITRDEFLEFTQSVWTICPKTRKKGSHPAPFPYEIPYRLIKLYTNPGDIVLDPFVGSGTTCEVADGLGRRWIGSDTDLSYIYSKAEKQNKIANAAIDKLVSTTKAKKTIGLSPRKIRRQAIENLQKLQGEQNNGMV